MVGWVSDRELKERREGRAIVTKHELGSKKTWMYQRRGRRLSSASKWNGRNGEQERRSQCGGNVGGREGNGAKVLDTRH